MSSLFDGDPKVRFLSDKAFRVYVKAICYCALHETDGRYLLAGKPPKHWQELMAAGLVVSTGTECEYLLPAYPKWNPSHAEMDELRDRRRDAGRRGGEASGRSRRQASASPNGSRVVEPELEVERELEEPRGSASLETPTPAEPALAARNRAAAVRFGEFYAEFPRHEKPVAAKAAFVKAVRSGTDVEVLLAGAKRYAGQMQREGRERTKILQPATWLNNGCWDDVYDEVAQPRAYDPTPDYDQYLRGES